MASLFLRVFAFAVLVILSSACTVPTVSVSIVSSDSACGSGTATGSISISTTLTDTTTLIDYSLRDSSNVELQQGTFANSTANQQLTLNAIPAGNLNLVVSCDSVTNSTQGVTVPQGCSDDDVDDEHDVRFGVGLGIGLPILILILVAMFLLSVFLPYIKLPC